MAFIPATEELFNSVVAILGLEGRMVCGVTIRIRGVGVVTVEVEEYLDRRADEPLATELRKYELARRVETGEGR